jgi:cell division protease FtsH
VAPSRRSLTYIFIALAVIVVAALLYKTFPSNSASTKTAGQLDQAVADFKANSSSSGAISNNSPGRTAEIQSDGQTIVWWTNGSAQQNTTVETSADVVAKEFQDAGFYNYKVDSGSGGNFLLSVILPNLILFGLMALILLWIFRQTQSGNNQALSFGRSRARLLAGDKPAITFVDVAGVDEAKQELNEIVEFLKYPDKFVAVGARIPK